MQVKSIAECEHSAILLPFIMLPFAIKTFVLSFFEWPLKTGFTVVSILWTDPFDYLVARGIVEEIAIITNL